jgi:cyclopropane-fatty-acyl-phospholipid synthase
MATTEFGASLTGVTLSTEQLAFAQAHGGAWGGEPGRPAAAGLPRHHDGPYDAICSIEMVEAVGREYWPTYFQSVNRLLKPGGKACIQSIVIDDACLSATSAPPTSSSSTSSRAAACPARASSGARPRPPACAWWTSSPLAQDYAETLKRWRERFLAQRTQILQLGFDERFMHIWEFYLAYCEAAFAMRNIDVVQYTLVKA